MDASRPDQRQLDGSGAALRRLPERREIVSPAVALAGRSVRADVSLLLHVVPTTGKSELLDIIAIHLPLGTGWLMAIDGNQ